MANNNNGNGGVQMENVSKKKFPYGMKDVEELRKIPMPPVCFNLLGYQPDSARFTVTPKDVEDFTKEICKDFFGTGSNGIHSLELDSDRSTGVNMFIWFRWDSPHIVDTTLLNDEKAAINKPVPRLSKEAKQFMELYCREENRRLYGEGDGRGERTFKCMKVDVFKLFCAMFDSRGRWYDAVYENTNSRPIRSTIIVNAVWDPKSNRVFKFEVEKRGRMFGSRTPLKPISAFKNSHHDDSYRRHD